MSTKPSKIKKMIILYVGLKAKEESMRELVKLAEKRENKAKAEMSQLLDSRSEMFETSNAPNETGTVYDEHETRIEDAQRRMEIAKQKFSKLRTLCISAEQGLMSLHNKLMVALEEASPSVLKANHTSAGTAPTATSMFGRSQVRSPGKQGSQTKDSPSADSKPGMDKDASITPDALRGG